jgi:hypothetical protein
MRIIKPLNDGLVINIAHAGISKEGQTQINLSIPLNAEKYLQGINLIDCIKSQILPNIPARIGDISQDLTVAEIDKLYALLTTGDANGTVAIPIPYAGVEWLQYTDNATKGTLSIDETNNKIVYT